MISVISFFTFFVLHGIVFLGQGVITDLSGGVQCDGALCGTPIGGVIAAWFARPNFSIAYLIEGLISLPVTVWEIGTLDYAVLNAGGNLWGLLGLGIRFFGAATVGSFALGLIYSRMGGR